MYLNVVKINSTAGNKAESIGQRYVISKVFEKNIESFEEIDPSGDLLDQLEEVVKSKREETEDKFEKYGSIVSEAGWRLISPPDVNFISRYFGTEGNSAWIYSGDGLTEEVVLFSIGGDNRRPRVQPETEGRGAEDTVNLLMVCKDETDAENFKTFFKEEVKTVESIASDYVTVDEFKSDSELVAAFLNDKDDIKTWESEGTDDEFEEEVQSTVNSIIGPCTGNIEVQFASGNGEYDMIAMPMGEFGEKYAVEAKDFTEVEETIEEQEQQSQLSSENLKSKLITQPKGTADRLGLKLIMIVNDIPEETYNNMVREADPLGVTLLSGDDYASQLEKIFANESWEKVSS